VSRRKPVVAIKAGRTEPGRRGARSHTAALATEDVVVDALFTHTGVIRAQTLDELIDVGLLLDRQPPPAGSRVAFIGNAGGPLILGTDVAVARGLLVPELSSALRATIADLVPTVAATANPVDLTSAMTGDQVAAVTRVVAESGEVDACIVVVVVLDESTRDIARSLPASGLAVPVAVAGRIEAELPVYPSAERAAAAVALAAQRARWLATVSDDADPPETPRHAAELAVARRIIRGAPTRDGWLDAGAAFEALASIGVPVAPWQYVRSADACTEAARRLGTPCVVKGDVERVLHKADEGAVVLGVTDAEAAGAAYHDLAGRFGERLHGAIVQAQAAPGLELLVGVARHPGFGPVVLVGAGGTEAELRNDLAVLVAPVSVAAATRAINGLRLAPLLHGYHGRPPLPVGRVADLVHRVSLLAVAMHELDQVDLNPVIVDPAGCVVVDARIAVVDAVAPVVPLRGMRGHGHLPGR
jgi:acyl-CoA synthetase (NDP forming)